MHLGSVSESTGWHGSSARPGNHRRAARESPIPGPGTASPGPSRIGKRGISRFPIPAESGIGDSLRVPGPVSRPNRESEERELGTSGSARYRACGRIMGPAVGLVQSKCAPLRGGPQRSSERRPPAAPGPGGPSLKVHPAVFPGRGIRGLHTCGSKMACYPSPFVMRGAVLEKAL